MKVIQRRNLWTTKRKDHASIICSEDYSSDLVTPKMTIEFSNVTYNFYSKRFLVEVSYYFFRILLCHVIIHHNFTFVYHITLILKDSKEPKTKRL